MKRMMLAFASAILAVMLAGCGGNGPSALGGDPNAVQPPASGYIPTQLSQISNGGAFPDGEPAQQHDGGAPTLNDLEGQWNCETVHDEHRDRKDPESYAVTQKTMMINEKKVECLPRSIDIRPYSPISVLFSQGFGYGSAVFTDASEPNELGIVEIEVNGSFPYMGNGFVCTSNGSTLALGILGPDCEIEENGAITDKEHNAVDECTLTEADYEVSLDGDRLIISCGDASASYIREDSVSLRFHGGLSYFDLYNGDKQVDPYDFQDLKKLREAGYDVSCDMDEMLASLESSEEFKIVAPDGSEFKAKVFNPYEKKVPLWCLPIAWYQFEEGDGNLTLGMGSSSRYDLGHTQVFGSTPYSQVYNYYPLPYESAADHLCYKTGAQARISTITAFGEGFDTGDTLVESEHSCDVNLGFKDGKLFSFTKEDSAYMAAGLQDNVERDDLAELEPSVYREVEEQRNEILSELKNAFKKEGLTAAINEHTGEVAMDSNVLFEKGSFELTSEGKKYLDKMFAAYASVILDEKFSTSLKDISFEGNTDSDGGSEYNKRLSENRAKTVMEYCSGLLDSGQKTLFDELAVCRGYGESDLVYDENGHEDKDASRRVAIKFMMKVDRLSAEAESQSDSDESPSSASAAATSSVPIASGDASGSAGAKEMSNELEKFRGISNKLDQAWTLYEKPENDGTEHVAALLLSKDHRYCAYLDLKQNSSTANGHYTFGETSVKEEGKNIQSITVQHDGDADKLDVIFNAWEKDNMVSVKDSWGGVNDLTAFDDVKSVVSFFEDAIAP